MGGEGENQFLEKESGGFLNQVFFTSTITLGIYLVLTFYWGVIRKDGRIAKIVNKLPGPPTKPIVGNGLDFTIPNYHLVELLHEWTRKYGKIYRVWLGNQAYVFLSGAEQIEKVLSSNEHIDKSVDYEILHNWLQQGLLTANREKWHSRRKLLTPSFHFQILEDFVDVFNEQSNTLVEVLSENGLGKKVNIFPYLTRCALDIICETTMGKKMDAQKRINSQSEYVDAVYSVSEALIQRAFRPWLRLNILWKLSPQGRVEKKYLKVMHTFTDKVIAERKLYRKQKADEIQKESKLDSEKENDISMKSKKRRAFLDILLDVNVDGKLLTDADIRQETDTFMFEGHDTTAANLGWSTFLLACHPEHQKLVHEELDQIFGDEKTGPITTTHLSQMKYLECCIKEALRMYPSVPFLGRAIKKDLIINDKQIIPKGAVAFVAIVSLHRDPSVFPNPDIFDPTRFFPENSNGRSPYAFIPFSAGPRNCIGQKFAMQEEKLVLSNLFRNYKVEATENMNEVKMVPDLILRPKDGLDVVLTKR